MRRPLGRALLLGATGGLCEAMGRRLAARGARLFLVARHPERLAAVAADLALRGATVAGTAVADLDDAAGHPALLDQAAAALGQLDLVVVSHGVLGDQARAEGEAAEAERMVRSNFLGPALLAQAAAARLAAQRSGVLLGISSVAGDRGRQSNYWYGSAKAGLTAVLSGLRNRLQPAGVAVVTLKPGFVDTPMTAHLPKGPLFASADAVAALALRAAERGRGEVYAPGFWRLVMLVIRHLPEPIFKRLRL